MSVATAAIFLAIIFAFLKNWNLVAVVLTLGFLILLVQWLTIDPPDVTDEDVHGAAPRRNDGKGTSRERDDRHHPGEST